MRLQQTASSPRLRPMILRVAILVLLFGPLQICLAKEKQLVTVSYILTPEKPLPAGLRSLAVIDASVETIDGIKGNVRDLRWSAIAAEMIEAMLQGSSQGDSDTLTVVQRRATKKILEEQDLKLAGIVEGDDAARAGKLLAVQGLVMSRISIRVDTRRQEKQALDWTKLLGSGGLPIGPRRDPRFRPVPGSPRDANPYRPRPRQAPQSGFDMPTRTISEISRSLTVQCSFALVDANTGRGVVQFTPPIYQKTDQAKPDFLFGGCVDEGDLDPVDHFIGELVERAARDFVSMLVPTRVSFTYEVIGKGKHGEAAVRALRADDYATAMREFEAAHNDDPKRNWHVFGLAVTSELMGDPRRALEFYRQAAAMPDVDKDDLPIYLAAKDRLAAQLDRILDAKSSKPASGG